MSEAQGRAASSPTPKLLSSNGGSTTSPSPGKRVSISGIEKGESSKRNSFVVDSASPAELDGQARTVEVSINDTSVKTVRDGRGSHRSHRSRGSASFLVSNSLFEPPPLATDGEVAVLEPPTRRRETPHDHKGKVALRSPEKRHMKKRSSVGLGIGGSPLAANVTNAAVDQGEETTWVGGDATQDSTRKPGNNQTVDVSVSKGLDAESTQIVHLALNLSESRRNVSRRNVSTPVPPTLQGFTEGFAGGSLRHHLQMQRRSSRNASPKPERGATLSPRILSGQRMESSLQGALGTHHDGGYQYHFSASTLARAEKAKKEIELMAQYRRLMDYVPPLKPQELTRTSTRSPPSTAIGSSTHSTVQLARNESATNTRRPLGRPYNPLQYIRNRKVRLRERKNIDGELQGFGDVDRVISWIDQVSKDAAGDEYQLSDCVRFPHFMIANETAAPSTTSPPSAFGRNQAITSGVKRPRVDWIMRPADMLADVYWLEQNDNKRLIEDNRERKIFPQHVELSRFMTHRDGVPDVEHEASEKEPDITLRIDTKLPTFSSLLSDTDRQSESARGRARQKIHGINKQSEDLGGVQHQHSVQTSHHRSSSESSDSDTRQRRPKTRRNATAGSNEMNSDILEKQMLEILAKESRENAREISREGGRKALETINSSNLGLRENIDGLDFEGSGTDRAAFSSIGKDGDRRGGSKGSLRFANRRSLEVPDHRGRHSLDGLDSTAPNSPDAKAFNDSTFFVPSIAMDLSPPRSRQSSPMRHPTLAKVKSKINSLQDRSRNHSRSRSVRRASLTVEEEQEKNRKTLDIPTTPDGLRRPSSPTIKVMHRKTDDSIQSPASKSSSRRRRAEELPGGIRGLFKSGRNPVQKVSDFIWRKEMSPGSVVSSNTSSDDSELEDGERSLIELKTIAFGRESKTPSRDASGELSPLVERRPYELPVFTSPSERQAGSKAVSGDQESPEPDYISHRQRARERRQLSRFQMLQPPRIDVQGASPATSPDIAPNRTGQDSDVSDLEGRGQRSYSVQQADARLNSILGIPGYRRVALPVTGLTHVENSRRPSSESKRHWSISDRGVFATRGPITKREIARVRALLLSSGIKAKEISRRASESQDLWNITDVHGNAYSDIVSLNRDPQLLKPVQRSQAHILAARILSHDIQLSSQLWQESATAFSNQTIGGILDRVEELQDRILGRDGLSEMARQAEREADEVSRELVEGKTMAVKELLERMDKMMRRRRRRFRWVRRAGWVAVEWVLVGVMWWLWLVVVLIRFVRGTVEGVFRGVRWLLWL